MDKPEKPKGNWWKSFYDDSPFYLYLERHDPVELEATLQFLTTHLRLKPGNRIFDQCCGMGSISLPLAERGYIVSGVDMCEGFIARATEGATALNAKFKVGDAFEFVTEEPCDAGFNWYTSFGYSETDEENIRMLLRAFDSLKPGAWFALDFPNVPMIRKHFQPTMERKLETDDGDIVIVRTCEIDDATGIMKQTWRWKMPDGREIVNDSTLRLYRPGQLVMLFERAGFTDVELYGSLDGKPRDDESPRCICVGRRSA